MRPSHLLPVVGLTFGQWGVWTDPKPMLDDCHDPRKLRLFACACARRVWDQMPNQLFRDAVELAEQYADGKATNKKRKAVKEKCEARRSGRKPAAASATSCLSTDASTGAWNGPFSAATAEAGSHEGPTWVATRARQADLLREIFGNPLRPVRVESEWLAWNGRTVPLMANRIYAAGAFGDLPVLADALEDAGGTNAELLAHLRGPREHVRGCWALDLLRDEPT